VDAPLTVFFELAGRVRRVDVERRGDVWHVVTDGRIVEARMAPAGGYWSLLVGPRSYEVGIDASGAGDYLVRIDGVSVPLAVTSTGASSRRAADRASDPGGAATVTAPMPGRVVRVLVAPGDAVAARQGVVVIEAMKMENELRAPRGGTVRDVLVAEGALVEANAVLVVLEQT
jgi:biotin carboxyl carrier protein